MLAFLPHFASQRAHEIEDALPERRTKAHNSRSYSKREQQRDDFFLFRSISFSKLDLDKKKPRKKNRRSSARRASTSPRATSAPTSSSRSTSAAASLSTCPGAAGRRGTPTRSASTLTTRGGSPRKKKRTRQRRKSKKKKSVNKKQFRVFFCFYTRHQSDEGELRSNRFADSRGGGGGGRRARPRGTL